jgi:hypothetical protein
MASIMNEGAPPIPSLSATALPDRKRRRRWFQFSLRTLFAVVTLATVACWYVGLQSKIVRSRSVWLDSHPQQSGPGLTLIIRDRNSVGDENQSPGIIRRWLGDAPHEEIFVEPGDRDAARQLFPEAELILWGEPIGSTY